MIRGPQNPIDFASRLSSIGMKDRQIPQSRNRSRQHSDEQRRHQQGTPLDRDPLSPEPTFQKGRSQAQRVRGQESDAHDDRRFEDDFYAFDDVKPSAA